ncbi:MAG: sortase [Lachnospiraceae bacterium]|jgi:LPXTG-site transpeptidase (sortase) family protein|nr:sortase [Lachnospiraceae bacterium]
MNIKQMDNKKKVVIIVVLVVIALAILSFVIYKGYDIFVNKKTSTVAQEEYDHSGNKKNQNSDVPAGDEGPIADIEGNIEQIGSDTGKTKTYYKGFPMTGTIEIPKTGIKYPILETATKKSLETAICILYPEDAVINGVGNLCLVGHNYRNGTFFSDNKKLIAGDSIYITDLSGNKVTYKVYSVFEVDDTDASFMVQDTNGAKEVSLSTCTDDSEKRTIVKARAE